MQALQQGVEGDREITYAIVMDASGVVFVDTHRPEEIQTRLTGERDKEAISQSKVTVATCREGAEMETKQPLALLTDIKTNRSDVSKALASKDF